MNMINPARVLCIGEILFDYLADQPGRSLEQVASWTAYPGGAPANVASGLVKLGIPSALISAVGMDEPGNRLLQLLQQVGVQTSGIQQYSTAPTRQVFVLRSDEGEREFAGFGERQSNEFADTLLQASQIPEKLFLDADFLVLGTLALAYPQSREAIIHALKMADRYNLKILVDINWRPVFWSNPLDARRFIPDLLKQVDFVKLSAEEAELFFNTTDPISIHSQLDSIEGVMITDGEKGCSYSLGEFQGKIPAFAVNVVDTTGAGDAFVAGFIHQIYQYGIRGLNDPETMQKMIIYALAVAALTVTKPGAFTAQPTEAEVEAFLKSV